MKRTSTTLLLGLLGAFLAAGRTAAQVVDTGFAALQERGKAAMGVDQYTSTHKFDALADGGRIELQRDSDDSAGVAQIRKHLREIAAAFKSGDFTTPAFVHLKEVPGTRVMAARRSQISYTFKPLPRGGEVRIVTKDPEALKAIAEFMAFQRGDHHAGGMDHGAMKHEPSPERSIAPADTGAPRRAGRMSGMMMGRGMMVGGGMMRMGSGGMNRGAMGGAMSGDSAFDADMSVVHEMLVNHTAITRTVTILPHGIRTVTESDNPRVAGFIIGHVASMDQRLKDSSIFNVASKTLPIIFQNRGKIRTEIEPTAKGVAFTQVSDDSVTIAALQAHASEVSELVEEGMIAMMRSVMENGGPMGGQMGPGMGMMGGARHGMINDGCPMMGQMMSPGDSGKSGPSPMPRGHQPQR
jgi:hypothetical protein